MKRLFMPAMLALVLLSLFAGSVSAVRQEVSPAIELIRAENRLIKCCVNGERVCFTAEEFFTLTGADFEYLTITKLPELEDGVLKLTGVDVFEGQHVSASGLRYLVFVPARSFEGEASFCFSVAAAGWEGKESKCLIRFAETENMSPVAVSKTVETYKNLTVSASLGVYDPDGDQTTQIIERYPQGGVLNIKNGVLTYTPGEGFVGADSFSYRAVDSFGNKSDTVTVDIRVTESKSGIYFADMVGSEAHLAAIRAAEEELVSYTLIGDSYYFEPATQVSRIDFAVMLVCAAEARVIEKMYPTDIFTDTKNQSREKRLHLETAVTNGFVKVDGSTFRPDEPITVAEALAMTKNALGDTPQRIENVFTETDTPLTKEEAAVLLEAVRNY